MRFPFIGLFALALLGCGGSSVDSGRAGRVADYAGDYTGEVFSVATGVREGTVSLFVDGLGGVFGSRRLDAVGTDEPFAGTISDGGNLRLQRPGDSPIYPEFVGSLVKRPGGRAVVVFAEPETPVFGPDDVRFYRLAGGNSRMAGSPPTTGQVLGGFALSLNGAWTKPGDATTGAVTLRIATGGQASGTWNDPDHGAGKISGRLTAIRETTARPTSAGALTVTFADHSRLTLDVRLLRMQSDWYYGFHAGTAVASNAEYALTLHL